MEVRSESTPFVSSQPSSGRAHPPSAHRVDTVLGTPERLPRMDTRTLAIRDSASAAPSQPKVGALPVEEAARREHQRGETSSREKQESDDRIGVRTVLTPHELLRKKEPRSVLRLSVPETPVPRSSSPRRSVRRQRPIPLRQNALDRDSAPRLASGECASSVRASWLARLTIPAALLAVLGSSPSVFTAEGGSEEYYRAYWLETEQRDEEGALALYRIVADDPGVDPELRARARERVAALGESIQTRDFARLLPPNVLAYVEVDRPGALIGRFLELTGLSAATTEAPAIEDDKAEASGPRFRISPKLVEALSVSGSIAIGITAVDPIHGIPVGVAVIRSDRNQLLQGLVETALAAGTFAREFRSEAPIGGFPTYASSFATIVVTHGSVIVASSPGLAAETVERQSSPSASSLASSPNFADARSTSGSGGVFVWVDATRLVGLAKNVLRIANEGSEEYAIAQAIGDIESFRWFSLGLGLDEGRARAEFRLRLADDNNSLAYHFLRTPALRPDAIAGVPPDSVIALAFSLSDGEWGPLKSSTARQITGLDIGRELFANLRDVVVFVTSEVAPLAGEPLPGFGLVLRSTDPGRTETLWTTFLGTVTEITRHESEPARVAAIPGGNRTTWSLPEGIKVETARLEDRFIIASRADVLDLAIAAARGKGKTDGSSSTARGIAALTPDASKLAVIHLGRALDLATALESHGRIPPELELARRALGDASIVISTQEEPGDFRIRASIDVPRLDRVLDEIARQGGLFGVARREIDVRRESGDEAFPSTPSSSAAPSEGRSEPRSPRSPRSPRPPRAPASPPSPNTVEP
jgi:hypothetical protein